MSLFLVVSLGLVAASIFGFIARILKQPPIVGYLIAGLVLTILQVGLGSQKEVLESLGQLGVTFLLFLVGLEMNIRELKMLGSVILIGGIGQIVITSALGFALAAALGFSSVEALYIAVGLTFSSTIVIIKLLSEKKDLDSLYGKIAIGLLLVQDIAAILALVMLSGFQTGNVSFASFLLVGLKGILLLVSVYLVSKFVLPKFFDKVAVAGELLFVTSIAWMLGLASLVSLPLIGFSPEIGGLLAGLALANSSGHLQIASRVKPLRDFFITIFFLILGTKMVVDVTPHIILPTAVFTVFVVIFGPLIVLALLGMLGHKKRTSFLVAITFAQVSEFSLILVTIGEKLGHISGSIVGMVTLVAVITITISTYLIMNSYKLYLLLADKLNLFEKSKVRENALAINKSFTNHIVLLGCDRVGKRILPTLSKRTEKVIIIDFNPMVVERLIAEGYAAFYGDASDIETLEKLGLGEARLVISTTGSLEDNLIILEAIGKLSKRPVIIFTAPTAAEALELYEKGADYVIVPQMVGGDHLAGILAAHGLDKAYYKILKERHFDRLAKERF